MCHPEHQKPAENAAAGTPQRIAVGTAMSTKAKAGSSTGPVRHATSEAMAVTGKGDVKGF